MTEPTPSMTDTQSLQDYVTIDHACIQVFPLLIGQLEIANQQLADGVDTLINGFTYLAQKMNDIDPASLGANISVEMANKLQKIHRFTNDLIEAGQHIHVTSIKEVTKETDSKLRCDINRIVLKTLDIQQLSGEIREQANHVIQELEHDSEKVIQEQLDNSNDPQLLKTFMELQVEINKMVIAFQFQDKVFQIINAVTNAMKDLQDFLAEARNSHDTRESEVYVSLSETMQHVERYYISPEQYELKGEKKDDTSDDIELF